MFARQLQGNLEMPTQLTYYFAQNEAWLLQINSCICLAKAASSRLSQISRKKTRKRTTTAEFHTAAMWLSHGRLKTFISYQRFASPSDTVEDSISEKMTMPPHKEKSKGMYIHHARINLRVGGRTLQCLFSGAGAQVKEGPE